MLARLRCTTICPSMCVRTLSCNWAIMTVLGELPCVSAARCHSARSTVTLRCTYLVGQLHPVDLFLLPLQQLCFHTAFGVILSEALYYHSGMHRPNYTNVGLTRCQLLLLPQSAASLPRSAPFSNLHNRPCRPPSTHPEEPSTLSCSCCLAGLADIADTRVDRPWVVALWIQLLEMG